VRHTSPHPLRVTIASLTCLGRLAIACPAAAQEPCFERLDNGVDTVGWQPSATNHHGPGLGWTVENGAMVGRQTAGQLGGILMTSKTFRDVEVLFEVQIDWGCDSGFFFRTTAGDRAYQITLDHLLGGGIGTIYGEGFTAPLRAGDYTLSDQGNTAIVERGHCSMFDLSKWFTIWHPTDFNEIRARIEGNPPHIQVWISNVKVTDFTDDQVRREIAVAGPLALQVHFGDRWVAGGSVRFRNIRARDLSVVCEGPVDAGDTPVDAANNPGTCSDSGLVPPPAANGGHGSPGCSCATFRTSADASAPLFLLFGCAVAEFRRSSRRRAR